MFVFADTCLVLNFSYINRLDILIFVMQSNGKWPVAIYDELEKFHQNSSYPDLLAIMDKIDETGILFPEQNEYAEISLMKNSIEDIAKQSAYYYKKSHHPNENDGESETLVLAKRFPPPKGVFIVTEDKAARKMAEDIGYNPVGTGHILKLAANTGYITDEKAISLCKQLIKTHKRPILQNSNDGNIRYENIEKWYEELFSKRLSD